MLVKKKINALEEENKFLKEKLIKIEKEAKEKKVYDFIESLKQKIHFLLRFYLI